MAICEYCGSEINRTVLSRHKKTAKYCLEKQRELGIEKKVIFKCECNKSFLSVDDMNNHKDICPISLKCEISRLKGIIESMKDNSAINLHKEPQIQTVNNTQNNTTINIQMNSLDLSTEKIKSAMDFYTVEHYLKGSDGMVEWMIDRVLTDEDGKLLYVCTDKNRKHFFYLNERKEKIEDIKGYKLLNVITPEITERLKDIRKSRNIEIVDKFGGDTQTHDDKVFSEQKKNKKLYDDSLSASKLLNKLIEKTVT